MAAASTALGQTVLFFPCHATAICFPVRGYDVETLTPLQAPEPQSHYIANVSCLTLHRLGSYACVLRLAIGHSRDSLSAMLQV